jgi:hypothetical protein
MSGLEVPVLSSPHTHNNRPHAKCGCKKHAMDFHGDHASTCTAHSGASKAHDWMVSVLGPLFRTAGHAVRTQHGVPASAGQRRGDVEIRNYLQDQAVSRSLVFDRSVTHERFGSSGLPQQNGCSRSAGPRCAIDGCGAVAPQMHAPSRAPLLLPLLLSHVSLSSRT